MKKSREEKRAEALAVIEKQGWKDSPALSAICEKYGWEKDFSYFDKNICTIPAHGKTVCAEMFYPFDVLPFACDSVYIKNVPFEKLTKEEQLRTARLMTISRKTDKEKDIKEGFGTARIKDGLMNTKLSEYMGSGELAMSINRGGDCYICINLKTKGSIDFIFKLLNIKTESSRSFNEIAEKAIDLIAKDTIAELSCNQRKNKSPLQEKIRETVRQKHPGTSNISFNNSNDDVIISYVLPDKNKPGLANKYSKNIQKQTIEDIVKSTGNFYRPIAEKVAEDDGWYLSGAEIDDELQKLIKARFLEVVSKDKEALNNASPIIMKMLRAGTFSESEFCNNRQDYLSRVVHNQITADALPKSYGKQKEKAPSSDGFTVRWFDITAAYSYQTKEVLISRSSHTENILSFLEKTKDAFSDVKKKLNENIALFSAYLFDSGLFIKAKEEEYLENTDEEVVQNFTIAYDCSNIGAAEKWLLAKIEQHEKALKNRDKMAMALGKESALYPEILKIAGSCMGGASISRLTSILRSAKADASCMGRNYTPGKFKSFSKDDIENAVDVLLDFGVIKETRTYWRKIGGDYISYEVKDPRLYSMIIQSASGGEKQQDISKWKAPDWEREILNSPAKLKDMKIDKLQLLFGFPSVCEKYAGIIAENVCGREDGKVITDFVELAAGYAAPDKKASFAALRKAVRKQNKIIEKLAKTN